MTEEKNGKGNEIKRYDSPLMLEVSEVERRYKMLRELMQKVMIDGVDYGVIPYTTKKKVLFKAGAQKVCLLFNLRPEFEHVFIQHQEKHIEYKFKCRLYNKTTGLEMGEGVGSCSTMETKYAFRNITESTDKPLPYGGKEKFWNLWKSDDTETRKQMKKTMGGPGFVPGKDESGKWVIMKKKTIPNPNIEDEYNTVFKQGEKRSYTAATLTASACSDFFTQDLIDEANDENENGSGEQSDAKNKQKAQPRQAKKTKSGLDTGKLYTILMDIFCEVDAVEAYLKSKGIKDIETVTDEQYEAIMQEMKKRTAK